MTLCKCGCGEECKPGNVWINYHHIRVKNPMDDPEICKRHKEAVNSPEFIEKQHEVSLGNQSALGSKHSDESREKNKVASLGNQYGLGFKHTEEWKKDLGQKMLGNQYSLNPSGKIIEEIRQANLGEKNPAWRGGTSIEYCSLFNDSFKKRVRDSYYNKCFLCDKTKEENGGNLPVHHVNYNKDCLCGLSCEFVPLCNSCHGKTNHNRQYWEDLIMHYLYPNRYFLADI